MPSKYDPILHKLKPIPYEIANKDKGVDFQDKVNIVKVDIISKNPGGVKADKLGLMYHNLRAKKEKLKDELSTIEIALEATTQLLVDSAEDPAWGAYGAPKNALRLVSGEKIEVRPEPYSTVFDRDLVRQWAMSEGLERLLTINWQTINSITKELLLKGKAEPPGVKCWLNNRIFYFKAGGGDGE